jgi:Ca2+-binding EF-hand superfamily protein
MWYLNGALKSHPKLAISYDGIAPMNVFSFEAFWEWFSKLVVANDVLSFEAFKDGHARMISEEGRKEKEIQDAEEREEEELKRAQQKEEERQRYIEVVTECKANPELCMIIEKDMILTGAVSSMEPENKAVEIQPYGAHVILMTKLLIVLGFKSLPDPDFVQSSKGQKSTTVSRGGKEEEALLEKLDSEQWWEDPALTCWQIIQRAGDTEVQDGVVDKASLQFALDVENYASVFKAVTREREKEELMGLGDVVADVAKRQAQVRAEQEAQEELEKQMAKEMANAKEGRKMTYAELCKEYDISVTRLEWLHEQFRAFLPEGVVDTYPVNAAALSRAEMRDLYADLKPEMQDEDFEAAFVEIDKDGSGEIEFDEFVFWLFLEEIPMDEE